MEKIKDASEVKNDQKEAWEQETRNKKKPGPEKQNYKRSTGNGKKKFVEKMKEEMKEKKEQDQEEET